MLQHFEHDSLLAFPAIVFYLPHLEEEGWQTNQIRKQTETMLINLTVCNMNELRSLTL